MKMLKLILTSLAVVIAVAAAIALREYNQADNCTNSKPAAINSSSPAPAASTPSASTSAPATPPATPTTAQP